MLAAWKSSKDWNIDRIRRAGSYTGRQIRYRCGSRSKVTVQAKVQISKVAVMGIGRSKVRDKPGSMQAEFKHCQGKLGQ